MVLLSIPHCTLFIPTVGHAEVSRQHKAHRQRAGSGEAEKVHRGLWTGGLNRAGLPKPKHTDWDCNVFSLALHTPLSSFRTHALPLTHEPPQLRLKPRCNLKCVSLHAHLSFSSHLNNSCSACST